MLGISGRAERIRATLSSRPRLPCLSHSLAHSSRIFSLDRFVDETSVSNRMADGVAVSFQAIGKGNVSVKQLAIRFFSVGRCCRMGEMEERRKPDRGWRRRMDGPAVVTRLAGSAH